MITEQRKTALNKLAVFIAEEFSKDNVAQLEQIAKSERIEVYVDHYENGFDGMLVFEEDCFHIHLNIDRGNNFDTNRGRFSLAHELAHYFIEEHRIPLMIGEVAPHGSLHDYEHYDITEEEADYFAACLLMPSSYFRNVNTGKKFSLETIIKLSQTFQASILATVLRFAEIGRHPILAVVSSNNIVIWYAKHNDFTNWKFRFTVHKQLPPTTVAGEAFTKLNAKYSGVEDVDPSDWFIPGWQVKTQMHEQCYYSESYGYVISLIWFD